MKNLENFFNSKKGKIVAWLLILLVAVLAVVLVIGAKFIQKRNSNLEDNQIEAGTKLEEQIDTSGEYTSNDDISEEGFLESNNISGDEEPPIEYKKLSNDSYKIDKEENIISFDIDSDVNRFVLSDSEDGPTEEDIWHDVNKDEPIELLDTEVKKKYVYYMAATYYVRYHGNGGSSTYTEPWTSKGFVYGTSYTKIIEPNWYTRTGYTFSGWATKKGYTGWEANYGGTWNWTNGQYGIGDETSNYLDLYAQWTPNKYKVTLNNQSATSAGTTAYWYYYNTSKVINGQTVWYYSNEACTTPLTNGYFINCPSRTGYTFKGYFTSTGGGGTKYVDPTHGECVNDIYKKVAGNSTLYAYWTANTYKVSFNANGGNGGQSSDVTATYGSAMPTISTTKPTKTGYTFGGWYDTSAATGGTQYYTAAGASARSWNKTAATTLYARWTANTYKVSFNANGGNGGQSSDVTATYGSAMPTISTTKPTKTGYTFGGWYDTSAATGGTQYYTAAGASARSWNKTAATTLYARWTENTAKLTYNANGHGSEPSAVTMKYTAATNAASAITATGYKFSKWNTKADGTGTSYNAGAQVKAANVNPSAITLYAIWTEKTATLTYNANGHGTAPSAVTMKYTAATNAASAITATGYKFNKWNTKEDGTGTSYNAGAQVKAANVEPSATALYAIWTANTNTVTLNQKNGTGGTSSVTATYDAAMPSATMPTRTGYTFQGYYDAESGGTQYYTATGGSARKWNKTADTTLYARWTANVYTISLNNQSATSAGTSAIYEKYSTGYYLEQECTNKMSITENGIATLPTKTGYIFGGYYTSTGGKGTQYIDENGKLTSSASTENFVADGTLYAKWTPASYTVTLNQRNGTGGTESVTATYNSAMPSATMPTRTGYTFQGYYDAESGGTQYYTAEGASARSWNKTDATTLYARWEVNTYTVTLNQNNGSGGSDSVTATYDSAMPSATMPTRTGYTFQGYYDAESGGTQYYTATGASARVWDKTADATLYAKWIANVYTISLNNQSATTAGTSAIYEKYSTGYYLEQACTNKMSITENGIATLPTKTGYIFGGYYTSTDGEGTQYIDENGKITSSASTENFAADGTLYAKWTPASYTVTLNQRNGTGGTESVTATYNSAMPSATMPTRTGYTFQGYYDAESGGTQYYTALGASARTWDKTSDTILHARWLPTLALLGKSEIGILDGTTYTDAGYSVAGLNKEQSEAFNENGYHVAGPIITKDGTELENLYEASVGEYLITYNLLNSNNEIVNSVTRKVTVGYGNYSVGSKFYPTLATAYSAITESSGIIEVERDTIDDSNFVVEDGKYIVLKLNGKIITKNTNNITNNGILIIQGNGAIKTEEATSLIKNTGILTIGEGDGNVSTTAPVIQGGTYAVENTGTFSFNDGILKGTEAAVSGTVTNRETHYTVIDGTETINGTTYHTAVLKRGYTINFHPNILPDGYQQVEYIESTGTQYIDTGFKHNQDTRMVADIDFEPRIAWESPFGSWGGPNSNPKKMFGAEYNGNTKLTFCYGDATTYDITDTSLYIGRHIWDFNKNVWSIDSVSNPFTQQTFQSEFNDIIFGNSGYTGNPVKSYMKVYSFKIYDNGNLVRDFIPCYQTSTGEAGLYDLVNGVFYTNQGTGEFLKGADIVHTQSFFYNEAQHLDANIFEYEGYKFANWNTQPNGSGLSYDDGANVMNATPVVSDNIDLYAQWEENKCTVTYDSNISNANFDNITLSGFNGSTNHCFYPGSCSLDGFEIGDMIRTSFDVQYNNLTADTSKDFGFWPQVEGNKTHWGNGGIPFKQIKNLTGSGTYHYDFLSAKFTEANLQNTYYKVSFRTDYLTGGTITITNFKMELVKSTTKNCGYELGGVPTLSRAGYTFNGWWTSPEGGTQITESTIVPGTDTTYYAHWTGNNYTITYDANINSITPSSSTITCSGFSGATNHCFTLGTYRLDGFSVGDRVRVTCDIEYTNLTVNESQNYRSLIQGSGSSTSWSPGIGFDGFRIKGTGTYHYNSSRTLSTEQMTNEYFNMGVRTDYITGGSLTFTNIKMVQEKSETKTCGNKLDSLPVLSRSGYTFKGWYTDPTGGTEVKATTMVPSANTTYYAHWQAGTATNNYSVTIGNTKSYYQTLAAAYSAITANNGTTGTIVVEENYVTDSSAFTVEEGKTITLDTNGKTITKTVSGLTNNGTLTIEGNGAILTSGARTNTIYYFIVNTGLLNIGEMNNEGPTIENKGHKNSNWWHAIYTNNGTINLYSGTVKATERENGTEGSPQSARAMTIRGNDVKVNVYNGIVYAEGGSDAVAISLEPNGEDISGTINIYNGTIQSSTEAIKVDNFSYYDTLGSITSTPNSNEIDIGLNILNGIIIGNKRAIHLGEESKGTVTISDGTIKSEIDDAIKNEGTGTLTIGTKNSTVSGSSPVIQGGTYGIDSTNGFNFYDGIIKGGTAAYSTAPTEIEPNFKVVNGTETINGAEYKTAYLEGLPMYSVDGVYYPTLATAYSAITGSEGTIKVEQDNTDASDFVVEEGKTITLDTNGKTITKVTNGIRNEGTLTIDGNGKILTKESNENNILCLITNVDGILNINKVVLENKGHKIQDESWYTIESNGGTVNVNDGEVRISLTPEVTRTYSWVGARAIQNEYDSKLNINGGKIISTIEKAGNYAVISYIGNSNGKVTINSGEVNNVGAEAVRFSGTNSSSLEINGGTVKGKTNGILFANTCSGNITINGGTIKSETAEAIKNQSTCDVTIGTKDGNVVDSSPVIQGTPYGISSANGINFYDGIIKGVDAAINGDIQTKVIDKEDGYQVENGTETIEGTTYYTARLVKKYTINFHPNILPDGYQQVEYIESTGGQYIDTQYCATEKTKVELKYKTQLNDAEVFGAMKYVNKNIVNSYMLGDASSYNNKMYLYFGNTNMPSTEDINPEKIYEAVLESGRATISDMTDIQISYSDSFTMEYPLSIFGYNENGVVVNKLGGIRIYYFRIYDNGNLIRDYIPCYQTSTGEAGLYDLINGVFYTNQGTGEFLKGTDVVKTQYFDYDIVQRLEANTFSREGYHFVNWNTKADGSGISYEDNVKIINSTDSISNVINLYAQWESNTTGTSSNEHYITFDANGGTVSPTTKKVTYGTTYTDMPIPTREGYRFKGWYAKFNRTESNVIKYGRSYMYTDKISIHVSAYMDDWSNYTSGMRLISCTEGGGWNIESPSAGSEGVIQFANYDSGKGYKVATSTTTWASLSSGWHDFDLVFDGEYTYGYLDGVKIATSEQYVSKAIGYRGSNGIFVGAEAGVNTTTPVGYYFNGYIGNIIIKNSSEVIPMTAFNTFSAPDQDMTLYARWEASPTYTVTLNPNGGTVSQTSKKVTYGTTYTDLPTPVKEGYTFTGWYAKFNGVDDFINYGREYMYTDKISIHVSAYMDDWAEYKRIISCTEGGGWNIESNNGCIHFANYESAKGYKSATSSIAWASLSSGWHDFDMIFDGNYLYGYLDGVKIATSEKYTNQIGYYSANAIFVGAEAGGSATTPTNDLLFNGYIGNIIIKNSSELIPRTTYNTFTVPNQNVTLYARWEDNNYAVGEKTFLTLEDAYVYASTLEGNVEIKVLKDNTDASPFIVEEGKTITLDTNGKTITKIGASYWDVNTRICGIVNYGTLNIIGTGTIKTPPASENNQSEHYSHLIATTGTLNITDATLEHQGITTIWWQTIYVVQGVVNLNSGNVKSTLTNNVTTTYAGRAIEVGRTGNVNITGGTIIDTSSDSLGAALNASGLKEGSNIKITGGTIIGNCYGLNVENNAKPNIEIDGADVVITGGQSGLYSDSSSTWDVAIKSGTIKSTTGDAIKDEGSGTLTIGTKDGTPQIEAPTIEGATVGVTVPNKNLLNNTSTPQLGSGWRIGSNANTGTVNNLEVSDAPVSKITKGFAINGNSGALTEVAQDNIPVTVGNKYTLSVWAKGTGELRLAAGNGNYANQPYTLNNVTSWTKYTWTFIPGTNGSANNNKTNIYFGNYGTTSTIQICGMKLEEGETATAWNDSDNFKFYDGTIKGTTSAYNGTVIDTESGYSIIKQQGTGYEIAYPGKIANYQVGSNTYQTLADAYNYAKTLSGNVEIKVLEDNVDNSTFTVEEGKEITLNTNGKTITKITNILTTNEGILNIIGNGTIKTGNPFTDNRLIQNTGILNIRDEVVLKDEISTAGEMFIIVSYGSGTINMYGGHIISNSTSAGTGARGIAHRGDAITNIYGGEILVDGTNNTIGIDCWGNNGEGTAGGEINIYGGLIKSETSRAIQLSYNTNSSATCSTTLKVSGGTLEGRGHGGIYTYSTAPIDSNILITGGVIRGKTGIQYYGSGNVTIGAKDGNVSGDSPVIQGATYGIESSNGFNFYDGIIKGGTAAYSVAPTDVEANYTVANGEEEIDGVTYHTAYLKPTYTINFHPNILPEGYTQVEYIESTGTQYIDTGYYPNEKTRVKSVFYITEPDYDSMFSVIWAENPYKIFGVNRSNTTNRLIFYYGENTDQTDYQIVETSYTDEKWLGRHSVDFSSNGATYDGTHFDYSTEKTYTSTYPLFVFARNNMGNADYYTKGRVYNFKIYEEDALVRNFIPCYRDSDNEVGLYDLVEGNFYTKRGTGNFKVADLPNEYQEVEYIESTTAKQYIDTDYYPNERTRIVSDFSIEASHYALPFSVTWSDSPSWHFGIGRSNTSNRFLMYYGNYDEGDITSIDNYLEEDWIGMHTIDFSSYGTIFDGIQYSYSTSQSYTSTETLYIFANHKPDGGANTYAKEKLYNFRIYEGNNLVKNFIPCYRKSDGVVGLYESISNQFYPNSSGNGTFEKGNDVNRTNEYFYSQDFAYDEAQHLIPNQFEFEGYNFVGWNTKPDGTGISYSDEANVMNAETISSNSIHFYAQWRLNSYKLMTETYENAYRNKYILGNSEITPRRGDIASITLKTNKVTPDGAVASWDVSFAHNGSVIAWLVPHGSQYDLIIGAGGEIDASEGQYLFYGYEDVTAINGLANLNTSDVTTMESMFKNCCSLTTLDISSLDTSNVTNMKNMFAGIQNVTELNLSTLDTSNVTNMSGMFWDALKLEEVNMEDWDTSSVTDMSHMFANCYELAQPEVEKLDTSSVEDMSYMFYGCDSIDKLNLSNFDTSNVTNMRDMFNDCDNLEALNLKSFDTTNVTDMQHMFSNCGNLKSMLLGDNFDKLSGEEMFEGDDSLEAIITTRTTPMALTTNTKVDELEDAILYVPNETAEATFESGENYNTQFGSDRVEPILELVGDNPITVKKRQEFTDPGVTVAGIVSGDSGDYTWYGFEQNNAYEKDGEPAEGVDTTKTGEYTITYGIALDSGDNMMEVERTVIVKNVEITDVIVSGDNFQYTGSAIEPEVIVKNDDGEVLVKDVDYTVAFDDNINVGTALVEVTGIGNYEGTVERHFTIISKTLQIPYAIRTYVYNREEQTVELANFSGDLMTVTGNTAISAGTHEAVVSLRYKNNYEWPDHTTADKTVMWEILRKPITDDDVHIDLSGVTFEYTGAEIKPAVIATLMAEGVDYTVSYTNNINVGEATVTITGINNYEGTIVKHFNIITNKLNVPGITGTYKYNGSEQQARFIDYYPEKMTVSGDRATEVGTYNITFSLIDKDNNEWMDNTIGDKIIQWTISPKLVTDEDINVMISGDNFEYTGSAIEPDVIVTQGSTVLVKDRDYTLSYSDNTLVGEATITVTGINNYSDTKVVTFTIKSREFELPEVDGRYVYTGSEQTANFVGFEQGKMTVTGNTGTNAGDYVATISLTDTENYKWINGSTDAVTVYWTIEQKSLNGEGITVVTSSNSFVYTGEAIQPEISITYGSIQLSVGTDYTVDYSNNLTPGNATISITGQGNYKDTKTIGFTITKKILPEPSINGSYTFTGIEQTVDINGYDETYMDIVSGDKATTVGTYYVEIELKDKVNYEWSTGNTDNVVLEWRIANKAITHQDVEIELLENNIKYTGSEIEPEVVVRDNGVLLVENVDYELDYSNNTNAGTGTVIIRGIGNYAGQTSRDFTISKASLMKPVIAGVYVYDRTLQTVNLNFYDENTMTASGNTRTNAGAQNVEISLRYPSNYEWEDGSTEDVVRRWIINPKALPSDISISGGTEYSGGAVTPTITVRDDGIELVQGTDFLVEYHNNTSSGISRAVVTGTGNYAGTAEITFNITKRRVAVPTISGSYVYNGSLQTATLNDFDGATMNVYDNTRTDAGTQQVRVSLKDPANYEWSDGTTSDKFIEWEIASKGVSSITVTLESYLYTYTGDPIRPSATVRDGGVTLTNGTDYDVTYENNVEVGEGRVVVTFKNNYTGTITETFEINGILVTKPTLIEDSYLYNGTEQTAQLANYNDEFMTITNNKQTEAGTYTMVISLRNTSRYQWADHTSADITLTWTIVKRTATAPTAIRRTYNGEEQIGISQGVGYTLTGDPTAIDAGNYTATAVLNPNYMWEDGSTEDIVYNWDISKKSVEAVWGNQISFVYNGNEQAPTVTVTSPIAKETIYLKRSLFVNAGVHTSIAQIDYVAGGRDKASNYALTNVQQDFEITRANAVLELETTSIGVDIGEDRFVGYTYTGDGIISVASDNDAIATCHVDTSNKKIKIDGVAEGITSIAVRASQGNNYNAVSETIYVISSDGRPKINSVSINSGAETTKNIEVVVKVDASSEFADVKEMFIGETNVIPADAEWTSYKQYSIYRMSGGNGSRTLYIWVKDSRGKIGEMKTASINLQARYTIKLRCMQTGTYDLVRNISYALRADGGSYPAWQSSDTFTGLVPGVVYYAKTLYETETGGSKESAELRFKVGYDAGGNLILDEM